jgi:glycosyltransferase involved in cell wall biosynthesis
MRVAFVHDWLNGMRGGEKELEAFCAIYPDHDIYTLFYEPQAIVPAINRCNPKSSFLQKLPGVKNYYRHLLPVYSLGLADLSSKLAKAHKKKNYDLVISINHCVAKNINLPEGLKHFCYCLTPMRYIWDQYDAYFGNSALEPLMRQVAKPLRKSDIRAANNIDSFAGISEFVVERINSIYRREAEVIFPPVSSDWLTPAQEGVKGEGFLCVNALVPYKNVDLIVSAFNQLGHQLTIVGDGPEKKRLQKMANPNIIFKSKLSEVELAKLYRESKALVFAAVEDFGMTPVEMQASGRPVIAFAKGGSLETVNIKTGIFFRRLSVESIVEAVEYFLKYEGDISVSDCLVNAQKFSMQRIVESVNIETSKLISSETKKTVNA